jgi:CxxC motif-containing protein (DUF1111 family)
MNTVVAFGRQGLRAILGGGLIWAALAAAGWAQAAPGEGRIARGRELFTRTWRSADPDTGRDLLGPMFNDKSCAACHRQGDVGGGGPIDRNAQLLTFVPNRRTSPEVGNRLEALHPLFRVDGKTNATILLHRFSTSLGYGDWRSKLLGDLPPDELSPDDARKAKRARARRHGGFEPRREIDHEGLTFVLTERNTPALFGASLIDRVSAETLNGVAQRQAKQFGGVTGRVPRATRNHVGRFGWRGQMGTLRDFVLTACAVEVGLQVEDRHQEVNPLDRDYKLDGVDLDYKQTEELIAFVESLPAPRREAPANPRQSALIQQGERLFQGAGCAACHLPRLGDIEGIFSDLLLHDMGPALDDPVPPVPEQKFVGREITSGYFGGSRDVFAELPVNTREWRTPPLWGVRDSAPYLHDGRAPNLAAAVLAHGGEAEASVERFKALGSSAQGLLLAFLNTLVAPDPSQLR